jgi:hypothetical protein
MPLFMRNERLSRDFLTIARVVHLPPEGAGIRSARARLARGLARNGAFWWRLVDSGGESCRPCPLIQAKTRPRTTAMVPARPSGWSSRLLLTVAGASTHLVRTIVP